MKWWWHYPFHKAEAEVAQAEASLEKLRNGATVEEVAIANAKVAGAKAVLIESEANYQRSIELTKQKISSKAALDTAKASRDAARASLQGAQKELLKLINGTRVEDLHVAEAHLDAVAATLTSEQKKLADLTIVATRDGILDNLPWNLGERVHATNP